MPNNIDLRDYLAGQALSAMIQVYCIKLQPITAADLAEKAYAQADEMLKARAIAKEEIPLLG